MWQIVFAPSAFKQLSKLDKQTQKAIVEYLDKIVAADDPKRFGKALLGGMGGFWRYRVGKYRIICALKNDVLCIEIIRIGKRDQVYSS